ncbi:hypothetical protein C0584_00980 [Candidatus Parcubacteria bacterium]|nr:MAG: hypothetical protein C0584_00980 [Candidatus Parcubacteria bacterium]
MYSLDFIVISKKIYNIVKDEIFQIKKKTLQKIVQKIKKALFSEASTPHISSESVYALCTTEQISPFFLYFLVRCPKQATTLYSKKKHFTRFQLLL